ncbi:hypothetical protein CK5_02940 [Blautia obeum A2-162]|uniref:Uncharacterized protein n=1 Tax=Blautia obeum A2-162 TaxID=657314 RepID=D4LWB4_9FIRM|nr:hypothetical protein CK5_02940 [Blautia obeum A2-162]
MKENSVKKECQEKR